MESVIHQTLRHVIHCDSKVFGNPTQVNNALMGDKAMRSGVQNWEMGIKTSGYIVGIEDRHFRG